MNFTVVITMTILATTLIIVTLLQRKHNNDIHEWATAKGSLGFVYMFVLLAGELFTTFTLLGHAGTVYGKGGSVFYLTAFGTFIYSYMYFVQPIIWRRQKELRAISQTDYFAKAFNSTLLGKMVTIVATIALIPYIAIQITGLAIISSTLTYGALSPANATLLAVIGIVAYSVIGGIRGAAHMALLKDILLIFIIAVVGIYIPLHLFGSWSNILYQVEQLSPGFTTIHLPENGYIWFVTTAAICGIGYAFWPHTFSSTFAAANPTILRKTQILSPLYSFMTIPLTMVGFTAILDDKNLPHTQYDHVFMRLAAHHLPTTMIIIIALGGILTALIPSTVMTISLAMNLVKTFAPQGANNAQKSFFTQLLATEQKQAIAVKMLVPIIAIVSASSSVYGGKSIQELLIAGYGIIGQLLIPFIIDIWQEKYPQVKRVPVEAIVAGLATGVIIAVGTNVLGLKYPMLKEHLPNALTQLNIGIIAIIANIVVSYIATKLITTRTKVLHHNIEAQ